MKNKNSRNIWGIPLLMALLIVFGLLSALLGTGGWYVLSWISMIVPLAVIIWKVATQ